MGGGGGETKTKALGNMREGHDRKTDGRADGMEWPARIEKGEIT